MWSRRPVPSRSARPPRRRARRTRPARARATSSFMNLPFGCKAHLTEKRRVALREHRDRAIVQPDRDALAEPDDFRRRTMGNELHVVEAEPVEDVVAPKLAGYDVSVAVGIRRKLDLLRPDQHLRLGRAARAVGRERSEACPHEAVLDASADEVAGADE